jgi:hypothetical protein
VLVRIPAEIICGEYAHAVGDPEQNEKRSSEEKCFKSFCCKPADGFDFGCFHY